MTFGNAGKITSAWKSLSLPGEVTRGEGKREVIFPVFLAAGIVRLLGLFTVLLLLGCGGSGGPSRYVVSGTVTQAGQPVPRGRITFEPDTSKGNSGPGAMAEINDGKFRTLPGQGAVPGPQIVNISGYDGKAFLNEEGVMEELGRRQFADYTTTADLPSEDSELTFEVPAEM